MTTLGTFILGLTTLPVALGLAWLSSLLWQATRMTLDRCRRGHFLSHPVEDGETVGAVWVCEKCGREWVVTSRIGSGARTIHLDVKDKP